MKEIIKKYLSEKVDMLITKEQLLRYLNLKSETRINERGLRREMVPFPFDKSFFVISDKKIQIENGAENRTTVYMHTKNKKKKIQECVEKIAWYRNKLENSTEYHQARQNENFIYKWEVLKEELER